MNILIPMAGAGSRFETAGYKLPKLLIDVCGAPMIEECIKSLDLDGQYIFVVRKHKHKTKNKKLKKILENVVDNPIIIEIDELTDGAAQTCLLAKEYINNDTPLVSANCDQILEWSAKNFLKFIENEDPDGAVVTYNSDSEKNSYIEIDDNGIAIRLVEKEVISDLSLTGLHYWKKGSYFVESAEEMINNNNRTKNEYYVAPTYNFLIQKGLKITNYHIDNSVFHPVGTPEDLKAYIGKQNEFNINKPKTISEWLNFQSNYDIVKNQLC